MSEQIKTAQDVVDALNVLIKTLKSAGTDIGNLSASHCEDVVARNGKLRHIALQDSMESVGEMVNETILSSVGTDDTRAVHLKEYGLQVYFSACQAEHVRDALCGLWNAQLAEGRTLKSSLASVTAKLERLREHALHKPETRDAVWAITGGKCFYCRVELIKTSDDAASLTDGSRVFHVDHLVPKDCGGPDHLANYVPSCQRCNLSKSNKPFAEFARRHEQQPQLSVIEGGAA